jgi:outer membrane protein assembly factor BamE
LLAATCLAAGCTSLQDGDNVLGFITPYRMEVVQGNVITREQADRVKLGATRVQVRDLLGSPLLTDIFHADRWDYVFTIRRQGTEPQRRAVVAHFEGDALKRLDLPGDLPSEREFVASISRTSASGRIPVLELSPEQLAALPKPAPVAPAASAAVLGPAREYPALERP